MDSLRAIAVFLVIIHHWLPEKSILNTFPNGRIGVNMFFVLSGFLITGILLKAKKQTDINLVKKGTIFKNFYARRTLRIFPIYYFYLLILWLLKDSSLREDAVYYYTYTANYLFYEQEYFPGRVAHLWSLGVEEQFYLFWPWIIIFAPKKILPYLILLVGIIGVATNYIFTEKGWWTEITTPASLDAFSIGAILSYLIYYRQDIILKFRPFYRITSLLVLIIFLLSAFQIPLLPQRTIHSLLAILLIYYCLFKKNYSLANYILNNKWLIRFGKISYGVYLYHLTIPELWKWIYNLFYRWGFDFLFTSRVPSSLKTPYIFIQEFLLLILIASISWKLIEKPFNNLKKYFITKATSVVKT